jgi:hypothetical protein
MAMAPAFKLAHSGLQARKGEADSTPDDIVAMVKAQCTPPHRLILFLQQSSVEWCSSLWMHVLQEVDPHMARTVVVASKFDNRLKVHMCVRGHAVLH